MTLVNIYIQMHDMTYSFHWSCLLLQFSESVAILAEFMSRKRKDPAISTIQETQGLFGVSDESRRLIFNASARALNQPDAQVKMGYGSTWFQNNALKFLKRLKWKELTHWYLWCFTWPAFEKCFNIFWRLAQTLPHWWRSAYRFGQLMLFKLSFTMMRQQVEIYFNPTHLRNAACGTSAALKLGFTGQTLCGTHFLWCNTATSTRQRVALVP